MTQTTEPGRTQNAYAGGCLCGAVRYQAEGVATHPSCCHCLSCRRAAGAPSVAWATFERARFRLTQGQLREFRSSPAVLRGFCPTCGSSLTYTHAARPNEIDVTLASLDEPERIPPHEHIWVQDKLSWVSIADGLPQYADSRTTDAPRVARRVRPGYAVVSARLVVADAEGLVAFVRAVFDAEGQYVAGRPAELRVGDSTIMVSTPETRAPSPGFLYVYVGDVDATYERALPLGARSLEAPRDLPYGDRRCMFADRWGNTWQIASWAG